MRLDSMRKRGNGLWCVLLALVLTVLTTVPGFSARATSTPTSLGLAQHGMDAYRDGWVYSYAGKGETNAEGKRVSDCAGLIYAYYKDLGLTNGLGGGATSQVTMNCIFSNDISEGLPRIHGLVLTVPDKYDPGSGIYSHIGIYIGNNEACDNSTYGTNMVWDQVVGSGRGWTAWHLFDQGTQYPRSGWFELDGKMVHYSNYQYDVDTQIDGYLLGSDGYARNVDGSFAPVDSSLLSTDYVSAQEVAAFLKTIFSGVDTTEEQTKPTPEPEPDPADKLGWDYEGSITGSGVNLRKSSTTESASLGILNRGEQVIVFETVSGMTVNKTDQSSDQWVHVRTQQGKEGFVSALYVDVKPAVPSAPTVSFEGGQVVLSTTNGNAQIYYTTDLSSPTQESAVYDGPLDSTCCTYTAAAYLNGAFGPVTTATVLSNGAIYSDLTTADWFFNNADLAVARGIFIGSGNGMLRPRENITKIQFVTALANLAKADLSVYADSHPFADVTGDSNMDRAVAWAAEHKYITGDGTGNFLPNKTISREEMCVILQKYAGISKGSDEELFADDGNISSWARDTVYACRTNGLVSGMGNNLFSPKGTTLRADAFTVLVRLSDLS